MIARSSWIIITVFALAGCAAPDPLEGQRTVFSNPLGEPVIDRTGIGPQCATRFGRDATCLDPTIIRSRQGSSATLYSGETIRLTRAQRQILRERGQRIEARRDQPPSSPPPAGPPENTTAD
ncbi:hypothetical protein [Erythrobacter sp. WG]|uniref:hypothetical protein n=1 Tax=Erythrobacter sp. WG TaxID=2985510 RepID=UPI002271DDBD|nr:hypothetical protein [Erythrobacter sp. WG]MCX9146441.1 hypothetical protein [Erythrobacter sp. WG]